MKKKLILLASVGITLASCHTTPREDYHWIQKGIDAASAQLRLTAEEIRGTGQLPRSIRTGYDIDFLCRQLERDSQTFKDSLRANPAAEEIGKRRLCGVYDWTSGFFPGSLWYAYELTGDETLKKEATHYTNLLNPVRYYKGTHDLGFMVNCSYGNAERLAPNDTIATVMRETADNLCGRFEDSIEAIRSWDFGTWNFPVIIDNMMNLDLLFNVSNRTGNPKYKEIALKHAMTTMRHHFRPNYTCWHVVSYNNDGTVIYNSGNHLGFVETKTGQSAHLEIKGQALNVQESGDCIFILAKDGGTYTVYMVEKLATLIGMFSFEAKTAFIQTDGNKLYVGKDSTISQLVLSKK